MRISISISEPWDLGEARNWRPLHGELTWPTSDGNGDRALVELDERISYRGSVCRYVVTSPRLHGSKLAELKLGKEVLCAFIGISDEQAKSDVPLNTDNWRGGGLAFIGDISPTN